MGKIRVICSDPYATDCSSEDEEPIEPKRPTNGKLFVQEISVLFPSIDHLSLAAPDSSSREDHPATDVQICINQETSNTIDENSRSSEKERHLGVKKTSSDKWEVQIHNPMEGTTMNLGSYNTFEEATNMYEEKNLELTLLSNLIKLKKPIVQSQKARRKLQKFDLHNLNISETPTGKWGACCKNPISKVKIWMGIYATPEEAIISYCKKKAEFESSSNPKKLEKKGKTSSPAQDTEIAGLSRPGMNRTKTAFDKKKAELEEKEVNQERCSRGKKKKKITYSTTLVIHSKGQLDVPYKGIRLRESGRWSAEIKDPIKRKNTHIGTYDTPEEAANAYSKRKHELEEMVLLTKKQKCNGENEADSSTITAVSSQNSEESNRNNNNENCSVINSYGELIGEYSRIDDELWLTGPGDYDECVVNGAIGGINEDLALDQKLCSYH